MKFLLPILFYPLTYLSAAFINWNLDAGAWSEMARFLTVGVATSIAALSMPILMEV